MLWFDLNYQLFCLICDTVLSCGNKTLLTLPESIPKRKQEMSPNKGTFYAFKSKNRHQTIVEN